VWFLVAAICGAVLLAGFAAASDHVGLDQFEYGLEKFDHTVNSTIERWASLYTFFQVPRG
jgi:hypothetical protein